MRRRFIYITLFVLTACNTGVDESEMYVSSYVSSGLKWTWIDSGTEEKARKKTVYEECFGEGNTLRLNQSMSIHSNRVFCFNHGDECRVYDFQTKDRIESDLLPDRSHHNNAQFSSTFLNEGDKYPLLILSRGDYPPNQNDLYVVRVTEDEIISFSIIKTIHNSIREAKNNGSWVIDEDHGKLYLYCMTAGDYRVKENNHFCVFSFRLPDICDQEDITLSYDDVIDRWDYSYLIHQGGTYYNGYLFFNVQSLTSVGEKSVANSKSVIAIDSSNGLIEAILPLDDNKETEGICTYDDKLFVSFKNGAQDQEPSDIIFTLNQYSLPSSLIEKGLL